MANGDNPIPDVTGAGNQAEAAGTQFTAFSQAVTGANTAFGFLNQNTERARNAFSAFTDNLSQSKDALANLGRLTQQQANLFNLLGTTALGASHAFDKLTDTSGIQNFSQQVSGLVDAISHVATLPGLVTIGKSLGLDALQGLTKETSQNINSVRDNLIALVGNLFASTDNTLKFQNSFVQLMGTTGQLGEVMKRAGDDLGGLNDILQDQSRQITNISGATNVGVKDVTAYYAALGAIPGTLTNLDNAVETTTGRMSGLQAVIQLSHGTGREVTEVIKDMTSAYETLGRGTQGALEYTARISQLSQEFGLRVQDTQGFLSGMANTFQFLGDNVDGAAEMFNQFFGSLRQGGLGIRPSIDIINQMTGSIARMSTAQRAFLSERTGGPGGLLGAVQIEQQLRRGDVQGVFDRMRQALMQQFGGRIITQGQVTTQADAAQFERQRLLLQSGAFGGVAQTEEQATRVLEALAAPSRQSLQTIQQVMQRDITTGSNIEQKSLTQLQQINQRLEEIRIGGGFVTTRLLQQIATPGPGGRGPLGLGGAFAGLEEDRRRGLAATELRGGDRSLPYARETFGGLGRGLSDLRMLPEQIVRATKDTFAGSEDPARTRAQQEEAYGRLFENLHQERDVAAGASIPEAQRREIMAQITAQEAKLSMQARQLGIAQSVGAAAQHQARVGATPAGPATHATAPRPVPNAPPEQKIVVDVRINGKQQSQQTVTLLGSHPATNPYSDPGY